MNYDTKMLEGCSEEEVRVFECIANGALPSDFNRSVIDSLMEKNLLNDHSGFITLPFVVFKNWQHMNELKNQSSRS